jgi:hypothetical protein
MEDLQQREHELSLGRRAAPPAAYRPHRLRQQSAQACDFARLGGEDSRDAPGQGVSRRRLHGRRRWAGASLQPVSEPAQRVGQLVPLDERGFGIKPAGEAEAADAACESTKLLSGRGCRVGALEWWAGACRRPPDVGIDRPPRVAPPQEKCFGPLPGSPVTSVTAITTRF